MSYRTAAALQTAVYERLSTDAGLAALVGAEIYDAVPPGDVPDLYVVLGDETVRERGTMTSTGAEHRLVVSIVARQQSFLIAKRAAAAVSEALSSAPLDLATGCVVLLNFYRARAVRVRANGGRRIDLTFRAIVED